MEDRGEVGGRGRGGGGEGDGEEEREPGERGRGLLASMRLSFA